MRDVRDGFDSPQDATPDRRRSARFRPDAVQLWVRVPGLLGWIRGRERRLLDCNRFGVAYEDADPPEVDDRLLFDVLGGGWRLRRIPGRVRSVDQLVRDYRVGIEFTPDVLGERRARRLGRALSRLDIDSQGH